MTPRLLILDSNGPPYVDAVRKARESGKLYEGIDMRVSIARAKAEQMEWQRLEDLFNKSLTD